MTRVWFVRIMVASITWANLFIVQLAAAEPRQLPVPARPDTLELLIIRQKSVVRLRINVESSPTVTASRQAAFQKLFAFLDRNNDGVLTPDEAKRLPTPFALRHILWGVFVPSAGLGAPWEELDANSDGRVNLDEMTTYYHRPGLPGILAGYGQAPHSNQLTDALWKQLGIGEKSTFDEKTWTAGREKLQHLDANDDELIGPSELVPRITYPGINATTLLTPQSGSARSVLMLSGETSDSAWVDSVFTQLDANRDQFLSPTEIGFQAGSFQMLDQNGDNRLDSGELAEWPTLPPDSELRVKLADANARDSSPSTSQRLGAVVVSLSPDPGLLSDQWTQARKRLQVQFTQADENGDQLLVPAETLNPNESELRSLLHWADRDRDGKLTASELAGWLEIQDAFVRSVVFVSVLDLGAGLFECLDRNRDGSLSIRELRSGWARMSELGTLENNQFQRGQLPRQISLTVSRGLPLHVLARPLFAGPDWFLAMDRNRDGDVSRREFTGPANLFEKLDQNRDGLLDASEVLIPKK